MTDNSAEQDLQENDDPEDVSSLSPAQDTPTLPVSRSSSPPLDTQQAKSCMSRQRSSKTRGREELSLGREKIEIFKQVVANNSVTSSEDSDDIFGKHVASEMRRINDPVEKMQARWSISRILYDAQERSMCKTQQPTYHSFSQQLATSHRSFLPYHQPPATATPHPPGSFMGMLTGTSDQQGEETY